MYVSRSTNVCIVGEGFGVGAVITCFACSAVFQLKGLYSFCMICVSGEFAAHTVGRPSGSVT